MPILFLIIFLASCNPGREAEIQVYPQLGHSHIVNTALFSDNGRYIVSASWDMSVKLWDAGTGRERMTLLGHTDAVDSAAISRDSRLIASASRDGTVRIWDAETGKEKIKIDEKAFSIAFGVDNKSVFTLSADGIKQWNIRTGKVVRILTEERCALAAFSPDAQYIAWNADNLNMLNVKTGNSVIVKKDRTLASSMAIANEGKLIALGGWDGSVTLIETESGNFTNLPANNKAVTAMAFSPDNKYLVTADKDGEMFLYDLLNTDSRKKISSYGKEINSLSFSPDTRYIVSASSDKTVKIWNTAGMEEMATLGGHPAPPELSVISLDNQYIASANPVNGIRIWNAKTGEFIETVGIYGAISSMVFSPDNEGLVIVSVDGHVSNVNIKTGRMKLKQDISASAAFLRSVNTAGRIASALWNGSIEIWNYTTDEKRVLKNNEGILTSVGLDNSGKYFAAGFFNGNLRVTNIATGKTLVFLQYKSPVDSVGFDTGGQRLVCGLRDGSIHLLDISSGKEAVPPMRHLSGVSSVSFSDDGKYVISGSADNTVVLWDAANGKKIASFISFDDDEWIAITSDGYYNASSRGDERLNVRIGSEVYGMDQFSAIFFQAAFVQSRLEGLPDPSVTNTANRRITAPPAISVNAPRESDTGKAVIEVLIKDGFRPLHSVQIVINGRLLGQEELGAFSGPMKLTVIGASLIVNDNAQELQFSIPVNLESGSNRVEVIAANREKNRANGSADSLAVSRKSVFIVNTSATDASPPDLWVLSIGSNGNLNGRSGNNLKYAVNNARGIQALFESQKGKRYRNVYTRLIADGEQISPTRENIIGNIRVFFDKATANDVLVLFLSGHGEERKENNGYYFLPQSVSLDDISIISEMPGRKLIFIDSCFSGGADGKGLARSMRNQSTVIITSSQKDERSWEGSAAVPYGIFTEALISGIGGEAAVNNEVRLFNLGEYVYHKVMLLSGETQHPYVYAPEGFYGFVVAKMGSDL